MMCREKVFNGTENLIHKSQSTPIFPPLSKILFTCLSFLVIGIIKMVGKNWILIPLLIPLSAGKVLNLFSRSDNTRHITGGLFSVYKKTPSGFKKTSRSRLAKYKKASRPGGKHFLHERNAEIGVFLEPLISFSMQFESSGMSI